MNPTALGFGSSGLGRRSFLCGLGAGGAVAIALPPLEAMLNAHGTAWADGTALPKRFGVWFWADGVKPSMWFPRETGAGWTLTPHLEPLAKVKADINVLSGFDLKVGGIVHHVGTAAMLSGAPYRLVGPGTVTTFTQPSVDVVAARALGSTTPLRSIEIGVDRSNYTNEGTTGYVLSHNGPNSVNPPIYAPGELFDRLFPGASAGANPGATRAAALLAAGRKSMLDATLQDVADLKRRVGARDQARLDEHLEGLRALERRLKAPATAPAASGCGSVPRPTTDGTTRTGLGHREVHRAMTDLLAIALACDITRVFSLRFAMWHTSRFVDVGATNDLHSYTHDEAGDQPIVAKHVLFTMGELAYFLEKLRSTSVGAGTLLDQCAILCTTEVEEGKSHSTRNLPIILAGRAGGALKTGLHIHANGENTSKAHLTLLKASGVPATTFGAEGALATDTIAGLT